MTSREEMIKLLGKKFPIVGTTEDFDGSPDGIWICGEGGYSNKEGIPYFDYYDMSSLYTFGVENKLWNFAEKHGWYFEWYDAGTIMAYPDQGTPVTDNLNETLMKKYRNANGDMCYVFAWKCGGGNSVFAESKRAALRRAKKFGAGTHDRNGYKYDKPFTDRKVLVPDEKSIRSVTYEELVEFDRGLYLMTI